MINQERKARALAVEVGSSGTFEVDGLIVDKARPELSGSRGRDIFERMASDSTVASVLFAIEMMLKRSKWNTVPKDGEDDTCQEYADFFSSVRDDMSSTWENVISNVMSMLIFGWSFCEIVTKRRMGFDAPIPSNYNDGLWGIRKLAFRSQQTLDEWIVDDNEGLVAFQQRLVYSTRGDNVRTIPIEKGLLFRAGYWNESPEGRSPLRGAFEPWLLLRQINRSEAYGIERELNGLPVVHLPGDVIEAAANGDESCKRIIQTYEQIVRDLRLNRQSGVVMPSDVYQNTDGSMTSQKQYSLELLSSNGTRAINIQTAAERHQVNIARCMLADFLMLGTSSRSGSQALGESRFSFFATAIDGWNESISSVLNRFLIPRIARINGFDMTKLPYYVTEPANPIDVEKVVNCIEKYVRSGGMVLPNADVDDEISQKLGLPIPDKKTRELMQYDPSLNPAGNNQQRNGQSNVNNPNSGE